MYVGQSLVLLVFIMDCECLFFLCVYYMLVFYDFEGEGVLQGDCYWFDLFGVLVVIVVGRYFVSCEVVDCCGCVFLYCYGFLCSFNQGCIFVCGFCGVVLVISQWYVVFDIVLCIYYYLQVDGGWCQFCMWVMIVDFWVWCCV